MELNKRKYKKKEVESIITVVKIAYEARLADQKEVVLELNKEIAALKVELSAYKEKEGVILSTMENAQQSAESLKERAELQYALEVERLKQFSSRWERYLEDLKEKYPLYQPVEKATEIMDVIDGLSNDADAKETVELLDAKLVDAEMAKPFNPKQKIRDYIAATGDNGFNLEEVLNPGELELEEICKELGLIDGDE